MKMCMIYAIKLLVVPIVNVMNRLLITTVK